MQNEITPINTKGTVISPKMVAKTEEPKTEKKTNTNKMLSIAAAVGISALVIGGIIYNARKGKVNASPPVSETTTSQTNPVKKFIRNFYDKDGKKLENVKLEKGKAATTADGQVFSGVLKITDKDGKNIEIVYNNGFMTEQKINGELRKIYENNENGIKMTSFFNNKPVKICEYSKQSDGKIGITLYRTDRTDKPTVCYKETFKDGIFTSRTVYPFNETLEKSCTDANKITGQTITDNAEFKKIIRFDNCVGFQVEQNGGTEFIQYKLNPLNSDELLVRCNLVIGDDLPKQPFQYSFNSKTKDLKILHGAKDELPNFTNISQEDLQRSILSNLESSTWLVYDQVPWYFPETTEKLPIIEFYNKIYSIIDKMPTKI